MRTIKRLCVLLLAALLLLGGVTSCDVGSMNETVRELSGTVPLEEGEMAVHFLDVGQGDAIFAELPGGKTMLIDAAEPDRGDGIIGYLLGRGCSRIDYLVATHPHADHIGSMAYIVRYFEIGEVWMPHAAANTALFEDLLAAIREKNLPVHEGKAGECVFETEDCRAEILAPSVTDEENLNNCSIVLRLDHGEASFLFTGDAEEQELNSISSDVSADVLKSAHHGSSNGNPWHFLQRVSPSVAVISCGKGNDYGHPHRSTLAYLEALNAHIYRTDLDGTVTVRTDGRQISVTTKGRSIAEVKP